MLNQKLLKQLTIMYVEDEATIRGSLVPLFEKLFKCVIVAEDGFIGLEKFKEATSAGTQIDIIISDINMPQMNGLDMLSAIKKLDDKVHFILTTAHSDSEYLIEAIKIGVSHYAVKPVNATELLGHIQKICEAKYHEKMTQAKQKEIEQYLSVINKVAVVSKTDTNGIITHVNNLFCEVAGYPFAYLVGENHNIVGHRDMSKDVFKELWETIKAGNIWKGKIKNKGSDNEPYYINATIFPIFDEYGENIIEYMSIGFVATDEENEKREFKKKVIHNIQQTKEKEAGYLNQIKILEDKLKLANNIELVQDLYQKEKEKNARLQNTVSSYESEMISIRQKAETQLKEMIDRPTKILADFNQLKVKYDSSVSKVKDMAIEIQNKEVTISKLTKIVDEQIKVIDDLKIVIRHREEQLRDDAYNQSKTR